MANRDAMPTRVVASDPFSMDGMTYAFVFKKNPDETKRDVCIARTEVMGSNDDERKLCGDYAALIAAAINSSTAAADLGFDPIGAIEALPELLKVVRCAEGIADESCDSQELAVWSDAIEYLHVAFRKALTAARTRGGER